ncbi:LysE family translocator [Pelagicoccus sp. SDUM812002]|uniref:LysE family translocator n=1 Tax=Pelagicoccus sp. SDUM812002 TaxID=3041266 RepID=UPI00280D9A94|nr:LysE family translocator [Pelagicoccus sp. SDUM812002]MDQ8185718.1 LysE family translocator [Pelagicoccus sp. SDUM812002]
MENYLLYLSIAAATVLIPGPAVMLTINNSIQRGLGKSLAGVLGIASAILLVAVISATSLGVILATSTKAFAVVKTAGALYLTYLGVKMWRANAKNSNSTDANNKTPTRCFLEGFFISLSNPKAVVFFMSIFPQFINLSEAYLPQFTLLAVSFSVLVILIHTTYALSASLVKDKLSSQKRKTLLSKLSGTVFFSFGIGLAVSSK